MGIRQYLVLLRCVDTDELQWIVESNSWWLGGQLNINDLLDNQIKLRWVKQEAGYDANTYLPRMLL